MRQFLEVQARLETSLVRERNQSSLDPSSDLGRSDYVTAEPSLHCLTSGHVHDGRFDGLNGSQHFFVIGYRIAVHHVSKCAVKFRLDPIP